MKMKPDDILKILNTIKDHSGEFLEIIELFGQVSKTLVQLGNDLYMLTDLSKQTMEKVDRVLKKL